MLTVTKRQQIIRIILFFYSFLLHFIYRPFLVHCPTLPSKKKNVSTCDVLVFGSVERCIVVYSRLNNRQCSTIGILISNCVSYDMIHAKNIQLNHTNNLIGLFIFTSLVSLVGVCSLSLMSQLSWLPVVRMISCNEMIVMKLWVKKWIYTEFRTWIRNVIIFWI